MQDSIQALDKTHLFDVAKNLLGEEEAVRQHGIFNVFGAGVPASYSWGRPLNGPSEPMPQQPFDAFFKRFGL